MTINTVVEKIRRVKSSKRGELEITLVNRMYPQEGKLYIVNLGRGMT